MEDRYKYELQKLGKKIRQIRDSKGLLQLDIELESGINRTEISRIENGQKNIEFFTLVKIAEALKVDLYQLFEPEE